MKPLYAPLLATLILPAAFAQHSDCRQSWMPPDAPAFCPFEPEPSLPEARTYHAVTNAGKNVYVAGGYQFTAATGVVTYYNSVLLSRVGANGRLGAWSVEPAFATPRAGTALAQAGNCLFLGGGSSSTPASLNYYDDVQFARIQSNGRLSAWSTSPARLKTPRSNHSLLAIAGDQGTFLYAVAGVTQIGADTVHLDTVEVAKVGADCALGPWQAANFHMKGGRSSPQALAVRKHIVTIGGWGDLDLHDVFDDVQVAAPRPDGSLAPWQTSPTRLTSGLYGHASVFVPSPQGPQAPLLLTVGGQPGTGAYANWINYTYVQRNESLPDALGRWRIAPTGKLPNGRAGLGAVEVDGRLFVIGGNDAAGVYYRDVLSARFDAGRP
ncbi:hypothetical protein INH39_22410 [Massilia violaceinigra]|uniref:Galactose oxidase n=1 Tax=Massilia violaceinigra TaxID=2045208 RepID=A0ABY4A0J4_9BURK|nr:hypothetical protein [Massilia violaceinigra]UOD28198.1 hypothetical protein INH39_22410 [Massilia violaceinigra]